MESSSTCGPMLDEGHVAQGFRASRCAPASDPVPSQPQQTTGALTAEQVVETAMQIVLNKITELQTQLLQIQRDPTS